MVGSYNANSTNVREANIGELNDVTYIPWILLNSTSKLYKHSDLNLKSNSTFGLSRPILNSNIPCKYMCSIQVSTNPNDGHDFLRLSLWCGDIDLCGASCAARNPQGSRTCQQIAAGNCRPLIFINVDDNAKRLFGKAINFAHYFRIIAWSQ